MTTTKLNAKIAEGAKAITAKYAKELLGWEEEKDEKFGTNYLLKDYEGKKIRCSNNMTNRPLSSSNYLALMQEILNNRWKFNGETIIISSKDSILNGQHTLIALILACQQWQKDREHWSEHWKSEPTIDKLIIFGVSEVDEIVNTLDTCKPRSLADVLYRSDNFSELTAKDRKRASYVLSFAIRLVWHRSGRSLDAYSPRRTHSESLAFVDNHPLLLDAVTHIIEEDCGTEQRLTKYLSAGAIAGMLYLMGVSTTESLEEIDATNWDKATELFTLIAAGDLKMQPIRDALTKLHSEDYAVRDELCSVLAKAWLAFSSGKEITAKALQLKYTKNEDGFKNLESITTVGGIDFGGPTEEAEQAHECIPTSEELEQRKEKVKQEKLAKKKKEPSPEEKPAKQQKPVKKVPTKKKPVKKAPKKVPTKKTVKKKTPKKVPSKKTTKGVKA